MCAVSSELVFQFWEILIDIIEVKCQKEKKTKPIQHVMFTFTEVSSEKLNENLS